MLNFEQKSLPEFPEAIMFSALNGYFTYTILKEHDGYSATFKNWNPISAATWIGGSDERRFPTYENAVAACQRTDSLNQLKTQNT